jgi:hypothetical protein
MILAVTIGLFEQPLDRVDPEKGEKVEGESQKKRDKHQQQLFGDALVAGEAVEKGLFFLFRHIQVLRRRQFVSETVVEPEPEGEGDEQQDVIYRVYRLPLKINSQPESAEENREAQKQKPGGFKVEFPQLLFRVVIRLEFMPLYAEFFLFSCAHFEFL